MQLEKTTVHKQESPYTSPRPVTELLLQMIWQYTWTALCSWTPKPLNAWRLLWLRIFGAKLYGKPFVHQLARITAPWNLIMHDRSALGERAAVYNLGEIELKARCTVAQEAYLCSATHKFDDVNLPLVTSKITIAEDAFIGARAFVLPGVTVGAGSVVGACSVVTKDVAEWTVVAGNPCRTLGRRELRGSSV